MHIVYSSPETDGSNKRAFAWILSLNVIVQTRRNRHTHFIPTKNNEYNNKTVQEFPH